MTEYGHDIENMKAFSDAECTIELDIHSTPKETLQKILGAIPIVRCKDCKHRPYTTDEEFRQGFAVESPDEEYKCPCFNDHDGYYSYIPDDDFFCANGEMETKE